MANEPGAAAHAIFRQVIEVIKNQGLAVAPGTMGTGLFSQLVLGMPVLKRDYGDAWTPNLDNTVKQTVADPTVDMQVAEVRRAMAAAFRTSMLCKTMLQVTKDGSYREFPTGRSLAFNYKGIIGSMQPEAAPPIAQDVQDRIDEANRVLFVFRDGVETRIRTDEYKQRDINAIAVAKARHAFTTAFEKAQLSPTTAATFPVSSAPLRLEIDLAEDAYVAEGGKEVDRALAVLNSVGVPFEAAMISEAQENFDDWQLGLSGIVPSEMAYSFVLPTNWCDPDDDEGFATLTIDELEMQSLLTTSGTSSSASNWQSHASASSGGGALSLGFFAIGGSHGEQSTSSSFQDTAQAQFDQRFQNSGTNLSITLQYGMCTMHRPWLISDLFFMKNWHLVNNRKHAISDGTIDGQIGADKLLPMIPQQFLVIKNVSISSSSWGSDSQFFSDFYGSQSGGTSSESSSTSGMAGIALGFINFGGRASTSSSSASGSTSGFNAQSSSSSFGATFDGTTLSIRGAQIIAFLSDIVQACPDRDAPGLPQA